MTIPYEHDRFYQELGNILAKYYSYHRSSKTEQSDMQNHGDQEAQNFARYLRAARHNAGLSESELAVQAKPAKVDLYAFEAELFAIEHGIIPSIEISLETLSAVAKVLDEDIYNFGLLLKREIPEAAGKSLATSIDDAYKAATAYFGSTKKLLLVFFVMVVASTISVATVYKYVTLYTKALPDNSKDGALVLPSGGSGPWWPPQTQGFSYVSLTISVSNFSASSNRWLHYSGDNTQVFQDWFSSFSLIRAEQLSTLSIVILLFMLIIWVAILKGDIPLILAPYRLKWQRRLLYFTPLVTLCVAAIIGYTTITASELTCKSDKLCINEANAAEEAADYQLMPAATNRILQTYQYPASMTCGNHQLYDYISGSTGMCLWGSIINPIEVTTRVPNPIVVFTLSGDSQRFVFSDTTTSYLIAGTYQVNTSRLWKTESKYNYTLKTTVNSDNCFIENGEINNLIIPAHPCVEALSGLPYTHIVDLSAATYGDTLKVTNYRCLEKFCTTTTLGDVVQNFSGRGPQDIVLRKSYSDSNFSRIRDFRHISQAPERVLALYALAMDNQTTSPGNLSSYYPSTIQAIMDETAKDTKKIAVILADLDGPSDTHVVVIQNGQPFPIAGLPDTNGILDNNLHEYNMADGATLGGFIKWARAFLPASKTYFSYVGHGLPLAANADVYKIFRQTGTLVAASMGNTELGFPIVPTHKFIHPDFSDEHPGKLTVPALISPYQLAQALNIGTNDGQEPIDILDIMHCFAASTEELYELSNPGGPDPYAKVIIGSPNYTYFAPELIDGALSAIKARQTVTETAQGIVQAYDSILGQADTSDGNPDVNHPQVIVAIDSKKILLIKDTIDRLAASAPKNPNSNQLILDLYDASQKYDTTYCASQNWKLESPDDLVDVAEFTKHIGDQTIETLVNHALIPHTRVMGSGFPWFADINPKPLWGFQGAGISLYLDLVSRDKGDGFTYLSWQADWYSDKSTNRIIPNQAVNLHHYTFVQHRNVEATNADILHQIQFSQPLKIEACLPVFPPVQSAGNLSMGDVIFPAQRIGVLTANSPNQIAVIMTTASAKPSSLVNFTIVGPTGAIVFSDTVEAGYLITGTYLVESSHLFAPIAEGQYTLTAAVDADHPFIERGQGKKDNTRSWLYNGSGSFPRPTITATIQSQWVSADQLTLLITKNANTDLISKFEVQVYQYSGSPRIQVPTRRYTEVVNERIGNNDTQPHVITIPLSSILTPGITEIHVWGIESNNLTTGPAIVRFNYVPPSISINPGADNYFIFDAAENERDHIKLDIFEGEAKDVKVKLWYKENVWDADLQSDENGKVNITTQYSGQYYMAVRTKGGRVRYKLTTTKSDRMVDTASFSNINWHEFLLGSAGEPEFRPFFQPVISQAPKLQVFLPIVMHNYGISLPALVITKLAATSNNLQVVIRNQGDVPVYDNFWVNAYIAPKPAPTHVNQIWPGLSYQGMVWGVTASALPLLPGGVITLTVGDVFYAPALSVFTPTLPIGTPVYAQVDSANQNTTYGNVLETHERDDGPYNNITGPMCSTTANPNLKSISINTEGADRANSGNSRLDTNQIWLSIQCNKKNLWKDILFAISRSILIMTLFSIIGFVVVREGKMKLILMHGNKQVMHTK